MNRQLDTQLRACAQQVAESILDDIFLAIVQTGLYEISGLERLASSFAPLQAFWGHDLGGKE